ncbi:MAG: Glu/Leu/Phe/Val dehydrogenase [Gammaproteobacteria bacterium]|nr:Glu/Leu/Phe/Val dehydrogenase [Gammaproteobacteria bacterium]
MSKTRYITLTDQGVPFGTIALIANNHYSALGGCRIIHGNYSQQTAQLAAHLANTMNKKNRICGLPLSGGKTVIALDHPDKKQRYLQLFAQALNQLNGDYITAVDIGTSEQEMAILNTITPFVTCYPAIGGDPSHYAAQTVLTGIRAACHYRYRNDYFDNKTIVIQGAGKVATALVKQLRGESKHSAIFIADKLVQRAEELAQRYQLNITDYQKIHSMPCHIFIAAADSHLLDEYHIAEMSCDIFAAAANNPFSCSYPKYYLAEKMITYLPDYLINGGGVICCAWQYGIITDIDSKIANIYDRTQHYLLRQQQSSIINTLQPADSLAEPLLIVNSTSAVLGSAN